jgi:hypothetical protein
MVKKKTGCYRPKGEKKQQLDQEKKLDTSTETRKRPVLNKQTDKLTPGKVAKPSKLSDDVPQALALKSSKSTRKAPVANSSSKGHSLKASKKTLDAADTPMALRKRPLSNEQSADAAKSDGGSIATSKCVTESSSKPESKGKWDVASTANREQAESQQPTMVQQMADAIPVTIIAEVVALNQEPERAIQLQMDHHGQSASQLPRSDERRSSLVASVANKPVHDWPLTDVSRPCEDSWAHVTSIPTSSQLRSRSADSTRPPAGVQQGCDVQELLVHTYGRWETPITSRDDSWYPRHDLPSRGSPKRLASPPARRLTWNQQPYSRYRRHGNCGPTARSAKWQASRKNW